jgi:branched-chain amino acid transport system permease protein
LVLIGAPDLLREFAEYRYLAYGALLVVMMLTRPEGLWPEERRRLELHEAEEIEAVPQAEAAPAE